MRIYLTSVEESQKAEQIQHLVASLFPKYSVVTIPNKYATEKGREEVREYSRQYYQKNAEEQRRKRRERYAKQKALKQENEGKINEAKKETSRDKKEQKTKKIPQNEKYAKDFAEYIIAREYELNEKNDDKQFCKKYCERYCR